MDCAPSVVRVTVFGLPAVARVPVSRPVLAVKISVPAGPAGIQGPQGPPGPIGPPGTPDVDNATIDGGNF